MNFKSDPLGAEIRTIKGQTYITPCALTVPSQEQLVAVSKDGYVPQTAQVATGPQPDHLFWQDPTSWSPRSNSTRVTASKPL